MIFSQGETSGTVTSPYYPDPYPLDVRCTYYIDGLQDRQHLEKVNLTINHIDIPTSAPQYVTVTFFSPRSHRSIIVRVNLFTVTRQAAPTLHSSASDVISLTAQPAVAIFELGRPFDPRTMLGKLRDDASNGLGVTVLTKKQTNKPVGD